MKYTGIILGWLWALAAMAESVNPTLRVELPVQQSFDQIQLSAPVQMQISERGRFNVRFEGPQSALKRLRVSTARGVLSIQADAGVDLAAARINITLPEIARFICDSGNVQIRKTTRSSLAVQTQKNCSAIQVTGNAVNLNQIDIRSGSFLANTVNTQKLIANVEGSSSVFLRGRQISLARLTHAGSGDVTVNNLTVNYPVSVYARGTGSVTLNGRDIQLLNLFASGSEEVNMSTVHSGDMALRIMQNAHVNLQGSAHTINARVEDRSHFEGREFLVNHLYMLSNGAAQAHVRAIDSLTAHAMNRSDIYYYQQPHFIAPYMHAAGSVLPAFADASAYHMNWNYMRTPMVENNVNNK